MKRLVHALSAISALAVLSGCLSPITLNRAVILYDEAVTQSESEQLLINIARAQHHQPIHFTRVPSIAATFDFSVNAGGTPALAGGSGGLLMPFFGGSVSENPTFTIVPIQGEEFTKRLLTPFHQNKLTLLLRQHFDVDLLLRMMAQEVRLLSGKSHADQRGESDSDAQYRHVMHDVQHENSRTTPLAEAQEHRLRLRRQHHQALTVYRNNPSDRAAYEMFRRVVLHLSAIQDQKQLYVEPLTLERNWTIPATAVSAEGFQALEREFTVLYNPQDNTYTLSKQLLGPVLITNYDPDILYDEERTALHDLTSPWIDNDVAFDIRPDFAGGEWPIQGSFRLRSFHSILNFLGHALGEEVEYSVEKEPRTPPIVRNENPDMTLDIIVSDTPHRQKHPGLVVRSHGKYYSINTAEPYAHWNQNAFQLLYILFRMTVTDTPFTNAPGITIAK